MKDRLYNKELKLAYINNYFGEENTKNTLLFEFLKSSDVEKQLDKDLYAFNDIEISNLLYYLKRDNIMSLNKSISIYKDYVNWCIVNGQRGVYENGENRVEIFQKTEDLKKYVSNRKVKNKFLTKTELNDLVDYLINPIDQAFIMCLYEFIGGEQLHELRSLKISDIDEKNRTVKLTDFNGNIRVSSISIKLIELLKETDATERYIDNNGMAKSIKGKPFNESGYIFKAIIRKDNNGEMRSYAGMLNKLNAIKKFTGYDLITTNSLKETRIIHEIVDVMTEMKLDILNDEIYRIVVENIKDYYKVELSPMQVYSIKQKCEQVIKLKDFN